MRLGIVVPTLGHRDLAAPLAAYANQTDRNFTLVVLLDTHGSVTAVCNRGYRLLAPHVDAIAWIADDCVPEHTFVQEVRKAFASTVQHLNAVTLEPEPVGKPTL